MKALEAEIKTYEKPGSDTQKLGDLYRHRAALRDEISAVVSRL